MKKITVRIVSALVIAATLVTLLISCAGGNDPETTETVAETQKANPFVQDDKLPQMDMDGRAMVYLTATEITGGELTVMDTEDSSDNLLATLYRRTCYVEDRYNVDIQDNRQPYGMTYDIIHEAGLAGASFDACYGFASYFFPLALEGTFYEFSEIPYVDVMAEWWDQNARKSFSVDNHLFFCTGDANMFYNDYTWVLYFNKEIMKDIEEPEPYDLVKRGGWTMDEMFRLGMKAVQDLNGDTKIDVDSDRTGMVTHQYTANAMIYGCNELFFEKDKDDLPIITFETSGRIVDVCEKVAKMFSTEGFMNDTTGRNGDGASIEKRFGEGGALFCGEVLQCARRYRGMMTDFGILPYPKFDENQKDYVSYTLEMVYPVAVTVDKTGEDLTQIGIILEAMQSASHNSLYAEYIESAIVSQKYLRDSESGEMIKLIFDTRRYPLATLKDFGGVVGKISNFVRINGGGYASALAKLKDKAVSEIEETLENIQLIDMYK